MFFKILTVEEFNIVNEEYHGSVMDKRDGFIHLSLMEQVHQTANRFYSNHDNLILLVIAQHPGIKMESGLINTVVETELFPHLYGYLKIGEFQIREYSKVNGIFPKLSIEHDTNFKSG
jgi:uncharacterized protein (DUF952 family)